MSSIRNATRGGAAVAVALLAGGLTALPAGGDSHCPGPAMVPAAFDPADAPLRVFEVEGPIAAVDPIAGTMTANGITFLVEERSTEAGDIATIDPAGPANITLQRLMEDTAPGALRSYLGGTAKGAGIAVLGGTPEGVDAGVPAGCMQLVVPADGPPMFVELAENVQFGILTSVWIDPDTSDGDDSHITINGARVVLDTDPRVGDEPTPVLASDGVTDLGLEGLVGHEGSPVVAEGYYHDGALRALVIETEILPPPTGDASDTVVIERVEWKQQNASGQLRVRGAVSTMPDGSRTATVGLHLTGCDGVDETTTPAATASLEADGTFDIRPRMPTAPTTICVRSVDGGGEAEAAVP